MLRDGILWASRAVQIVDGFVMHSVGDSHVRAGIYVHAS